MASSSDDEPSSRLSTNSARSPQRFPLANITSQSSSNAVPEQALASDSSLSRPNTPGSLTSTAATSLETAQTPSVKARSTSHGSNGAKLSPNVSIHSEAGRSGHHASQALETIPQAALPSPVLQLPGRQLTGDDEQSQHNIPPRTNSVWSIPLSWTATIGHRLSKKHFGQSVIQFAALVCALVSTAFYTYRSYVVSLWQSEHDFYDWCRGVQPGAAGHAVCNATLKIALREPPYSHASKEAKKSKRDLGTTASPKAWPLASWGWQRLLVDLIVLGGLFVGIYAVIVLLQSNWLRRRNQPRRDGRPAFDSFWPLTQRYRQVQDPFSPVHVRLGPQWRPKSPSSAGPTSATKATGTDEKPRGAASKRTRIMPTIPGRPNTRAYFDEIRRRSLKPDEELSMRPPWKEKDGLSIYAEDDGENDDILTSEENDGKESAEQTFRRGTQVGDALKGTTDDDLLLQFSGSGGWMGGLRRRLHTKYPRLPYLFHYNSSTDDLEPPLTALGADPEEEDESGDEAPRGPRRNVVLSGFVAMGMAQSGAALASTVGGAIGQEILVQSVECDADMVLPGAPQDLSTISTGSNMMMGSRAVVPSMAF